MTIKLTELIGRRFVDSVNTRVMIVYHVLVSYQRIWNTESSDSRNLNLRTTPMLLCIIETWKLLSSNPIALDLVIHCNVNIVRK